MERNTHTLGSIVAAVLVWVLAQGLAAAQDLEPRRWAHLPVSTNVAGLSYLNSQGGVFFDPVLQLTGAQLNAHSLVANYSRWFGVFGKTGRVDMILPYTTAEWEGNLDGAQASTQRDGFSDPWVRFSLNFVGAPALSGAEYMKYRAAHPNGTVAGAALWLSLPLGEYQSDKLINLGQNRFTIRPQAGVVHTHGPWSFELTGSAFFYTANDDFFNGNTLEQDPVYAFQAHAIHTFPNRWWLALSGGYNWGGEASINGVPKNDERANILSAISFGFPVAKTQALKLVYMRADAQNTAGQDTDNLLLSWSVRF